jgi:hypothetical protein
MRCMIIIKATKDSEAGAMPAEALIARKVDYHQVLAKASVLLDAPGLKRERRGVLTDREGCGQQTRRVSLRSPSHGVEPDRPH